MSDNSLKDASHLRDSDVVTAPSLAASGIRHAFFTRRGGVSTDIYAGLNMGIGSKDDPEAVHENRARAAHFLGLTGPDLVTPWQVHSTTAVIVTEPFAGWENALTRRPMVPSGSVSLARTSTAVGVSSFIDSVSATATGGSFEGVTSIDTMAVDVPPLPSEIVYENESEPL